MAITLIVADDHRIVRDGLRSMLESETDFAIVAEAADGWETVELAKQLKPDVIVMDVSMPGLNGMEATRRIKGLDLGCRVLALSGHRSEKYIKGMLQAGAAGYLLKECAGEELFTAIRTLVVGNLYVSPAVAGTVIADYLEHLNAAVEPQNLTGREREVLQLIAEGGSTAAIADTLSLSVKTIESHRQRIMHKLDIRTIAGLTKYAIRTGITSLGD